MAGVKQVIVGNWPGGTTTTSYRPIFRNGFTWVTAVPLPQPWLAQGMFGRLKITHDTDPGSGKTFTYTLVINGVDSALSATVDHSNFSTGATCLNNVYVADGVTVYWKRTSSGAPTAPTRIHATMEFNGAFAGQSSYGYVGSALNNIGSTRNCPFSSANWATNNVANRFSLVSAAGDCTKYRIDLSAAPGAGGSGKKYDFVLYKNGTKQDGSGGTVDTRGTISETATTVTVSFTLALSGSDQLVIEATATNTPASVNASIGTQFTATTDGQSQFCFGESSAINETTTKYMLAYDPDTTETTTEGNADWITSPVNGFILKNLYQRWAVLGGPTSSVGTVRKNGGAGATTCTVTGPATTCNDTTNSDTYTVGNTAALERNLTAGGLRIGFFALTMQADSDYQPLSPMLTHGYLFGA